MEFGKTVAELRNKRGWTQEKLAARAGVTRETVAAWESGGEFPAQAQLLDLAMALKVKVERLVTPDAELMVSVIEGTEMIETAVMAAASAVTLVCALALVAISHTAPESVELASHVTEVVLLLALLALLYLRRSPAAQRAKAFRDALEAADGSQTNFIVKRRAGRNTRNVVLQFVLGAIIALTLIVLLGVIVPESRLPWVMF